MSKRWICVLRGHRYVRFRYPDANSADPYLLRCRRCGHEREPLPPEGRGAIIAGM